MKHIIISIIATIAVTGFVQADNAPKTLLFSPIIPEYLADTAPSWAEAGFGGFLISGVMSNWDSDVWAVDGDPETRGRTDGTFQRLQRCTEACRAAGIEDNFIKVAFYSHIPDWFDDPGWETLCERFRSGAELARLAGLRGMAVDIEYIAEIYDLDWEGYQDKPQSSAERREKAKERGEQMVTAMFDAYPEMVLLLLPESANFYGPLAADLTVGFFQAAVSRDAPGGVHVLTEGTYTLTQPMALLSRFVEVAGKLEEVFTPPQRDYWRKRCSIAVGCWPLGYYREILDENGKRLWYSGRRETFGDRDVGSYADKSSNYSPSEFHTQYAFATSFARRYNWIYGHGSTWWQLTEAEAKRYGAGEKQQLPADERLDDYKSIVRAKTRLAEPLFAELAEEYSATGRIEIADRLGLIQDWLVLGPFENLEEPPNRHTALRSTLIDTSVLRFPDTVTANDGNQLRWRKCRATPRSGYVDAGSLFEPHTNVSYFALCYVTSPVRRPAQLRVGGNDAVAVWFNGEKLFEGNRSSTASIDEDQINIVLPEGTCPILLQICQGGGSTGFFARLTRDDGDPLDRVTFSIRP